jgi:membrane-bound lytic murein transglycosylase D
MALYGCATGPGSATGNAQPPASGGATQASVENKPVGGGAAARPATETGLTAAAISPGAPAEPLNTNQAVAGPAPAPAAGAASGPASGAGAGPSSTNSSSNGASPASTALAANSPTVSATDTATETTPAPTPVPVDPLRPEVRIILTDREPQIDLWTRLRRGFAMPDLNGELTRQREQAYAGQPDAFQRMTERGSRYLFHIVEEVEKRGMPSELALLPFVESAFNPQALSSAKASGIWQFMPATGRHFDLKQNVFRDDRRDVLASTRAALDYLQKLHGMFGDWHLALAAYNWGEGSVARALARNKAAGLPLEYGQLKMPRETQNYVPKLQAIKNLIARPESFGLRLPELANHPAFLSVPIERDIDVDLAAKLAGMPIEDFKVLNPQTNKPVLLAAGTAQVLLPYDNANQFVRRLPQHRGPLASWTAWVAPKTLRPADAAKQVGMTEDELREVNRIPPRMLVKAGSTLLVPRSRSRQTDVSEHLADNAVMTLAPDGPALRKLALRAGKNDSVASVAKRYRVSPAQVGQWNKVAASARFKAGQTIVVFVAGKAPTAKSTRHRTAKAKSSVRPVRKSASKAGSVRVSKN